MEPDDILGRLAALETQNGQLGRNMQSLLDAIAVTGAIELRHAERLKDHQEWLEALQSAEQQQRERLDELSTVFVEGLRQQQETLRQQQETIKQQQETLRLQQETIKQQQETLRLQQEAQRLHEQRMAEIEDKLNALIDIIDRMQRPPDGR